MLLATTLLSQMAMQYLNVPYRWAGNNVAGFDCSGFVLKTLHDVGVTLPDMTSQSIYFWAIKQEFQSCEPGEDCLLFFGPHFNAIKHVAISLNEGKYMIEAAGAGRDSLNLDAESLARMDARVRIKPITNRKDFLTAIKITY